MPPITDDSTGRYVQTQKWRLHYNEAGTGHPIILLHGSGPGATAWNNFMPNIVGLAKRYRVIAIDLPGWGGSDCMDPTEQNRALANAEAVKMVMDELGLECAVLAGTASGGIDALHFAAIYPERLSHLITTGAPVPASPPNIFAPHGLPDGVRYLRAAYAEPTSENFRRMATAMVYNPALVTDEFCESRSISARKRPEHLENWLKGLGPNAIPGLAPGELIARVSAYPGPALLMHGRDDRLVSMENTLRLVGSITGASAHIFNCCGHWCQLEHPEWYNTLIDGFLQSHGVAPAQ